MERIVQLRDEAKILSHLSKEKSQLADELERKLTGGKIAKEERKMGKMMKKERISHFPQARFIINEKATSSQYYPLLACNLSEARISLEKNREIFTVRTEIDKMTDDDIQKYEDVEHPRQCRFPTLDSLHGFQKKYISSFIHAIYAFVKRQMPHSEVIIEKIEYKPFSIYTRVIYDRKVVYNFDISIPKVSDMYDIIKEFKSAGIQYDYSRITDLDMTDNEKFDIFIKTMLPIVFVKFKDERLASGGSSLSRKKSTIIKKKEKHPIQSQDIEKAIFEEKEEDSQSISDCESDHVKVLEKEFSDYLTEIDEEKINKEG